jgi:hypothetical protein
MIDYHTIDANRGVPGASVSPLDQGMLRACLRGHRFHSSEIVAVEDGACYFFFVGKREGREEREKSGGGVGKGKREENGQRAVEISIFIPGTGEQRIRADTRREEQSAYINVAKGNFTYAIVNEAREGLVRLNAGGDVEEVPITSVHYFCASQ